MWVKGAPALLAYATADTPVQPWDTAIWYDTLPGIPSSAVVLQTFNAWMTPTNPQHGVGQQKCNEHFTPATIRAEGYCRHQCGQFLGISYIGLWGHLSNMNAVFNRWPMLWYHWKPNKQANKILQNKQTKTPCVLLHVSSYLHVISVVLYLRLRPPWNSSYLIHLSIWTPSNNQGIEIWLSKLKR